MDPEKDDVKDVEQDRSDEALDQKTDEDLKDDDKGAKDDAADSKKADGKGDEEVDEGKRDDVDSKEDKDKRVRIPKWRFDEAVSRARAREEALQAQIRDLEAKMPAKPAADDENSIPNLEKQLDKLDDEYETHLSNGEKDKAAAVRAKKRVVEREIVSRQAEERAWSTKEAAKQELRYEAALAKTEAEYPQLNPESEEYDKDLAEEIAALRDGLAAKGVSAATALERAVRRIAGPPKGAGDDGTKARRDKEARDAALRATGKTPSRLDKAGLDSDKAGGTGGSGKSIMQMSQEEFAKLSEEQKSAIRGDVL